MSIARRMQMASAGSREGWNLANAVGNFGPYGFLLVDPQDTQPRGLFLKPDGAKVYVVGDTGDAVYEYNLSIAWDLSSGVYLQSFSVAAQDTIPTGLFFKPDGTKMYVLGSSGDDVNEYDLSTAWDISTASYLQNFSVSAQDIAPEDVFFKADGTKMYVLGSGGDAVYEYDLSTAWDISTASYLQNFSVSAQDALPTGLFFKPDGNKMYVLGDSGDDVNEYDLSTAWDISTASYLQNFSVSAFTTAPQGVTFKPDGTEMYVVSRFLNSRGVFGFGLGTAWDISTSAWLSPQKNALFVQDQEALPRSVFFKPDGTKMYHTGGAGDAVYEYDLSTAWDISTASYLQSFSVIAQENNPFGLFFKPDGTKMYVLGSGGDDVNEYDLSTAWDISTASYLQNFSVASQETIPAGLFFKPDGTKMYISGQSGDDINEYDLSTAWDVSTASYLQTFSVAAQDVTPAGLAFRPDGTKMYFPGQSGDDVNEYDLSTAWDISTASYLQNFSVAAQDTLPTGLAFRPDGNKMYLIGSARKCIWAYDL